MLDSKALVSACELLMLLYEPLLLVYEALLVCRLLMLGRLAVLSAECKEVNQNE